MSVGRRITTPDAGTIDVDVEPYDVISLIVDTPMFGVPAVGAYLSREHASALIAALRAGTFAVVEHRDGEMVVVDPTNPAGCALVVEGLGVSLTLFLSAQNATDLANVLEVCVVTRVDDPRDPRDPCDIRREVVRWFSVELDRVASQAIAMGMPCAAVARRLRARAEATQALVATEENAAPDVDDDIVDGWNP